MGTDYLELFDRRTAELILGAEDFELITLVESRTTSKGPPVWREYWEPTEQRLVDFPRLTKTHERLTRRLQRGTSIEEIKEELLRELCVGSNFLYLDYWGCWVEAFPVEEPPGAVRWEDFTAPIRRAAPKVREDLETSGSYLLTDENVSGILHSLNAHQRELTIMKEPDIERLRRWQAFCRKNFEFCILYQIDF